LQFEAGKLKYYSHEWEKITADSNLLDIVKHCHIEFIDNIKQCQTKAPFQNIFNEKEKEIIDKEICAHFKMLIWNKLVHFFQIQNYSKFIIFLRSNKYCRQKYAFFYSVPF
jgi:hypothetical protein